MTSDKDFFWSKKHTMQDIVNSIAFFNEEASMDDRETYTEDEKTTLLMQARNVQREAEEIIKRITLPSLSTPAKKTIRIRRKK